MFKLFSKKEAASVHMPEPEEEKNAPPDSIDGYTKVHDYRYQDFFFKRAVNAPKDYPISKMNGTLTLSQRPWSLDSKRVELWLDNPDYHYIVGELFPSPIRDMCNQWLDEGKPTYVVITGVEEKSKIIKMRIALYDKTDNE